MELERKLGVGIVMLIPTFVFSGVIWSFVHSYLAVLGWVIIMGFTYRAIVTGKFRSAKENVKPA